VVTAPNFGLPACAIALSALMLELLAAY